MITGKFSKEQIKALSKEEMISLFKRFNDGDMKAREELINHNIGLVMYCVNKFDSNKYDQDELFSTGLIGLIKAVDTFDISKDLEFASYGTKCINNEIFMFLRKDKKHLVNVSLSSAIYSSEKDNSELTLEDAIEDKNSEKFVFDIEDKNAYDILREIIENLSERDKRVVILYYGLDGNREHTQQEIGDKLDISQSYTSRLIEKLTKQIKIKYDKYDNDGIMLDNKKKTSLKENVHMDIDRISEKDMEMKVENKNMSKGKKLQTIYEMFNEYPKELIDMVISNLPEKDRELLRIRYGEDLENPNPTEKWNKELNSKLYGNVLRKIKNILFKLENKKIKENNTNTKKISKEENNKEISKKIKKLKTIYEQFSEYEKELVDKAIEMLPEKDKELLRIRYGEDLENPNPTEQWNKELNSKLYGTVFPKIKSRLLKLKNLEEKIKEDEIKETIEKSNVETLSDYDKDNVTDTKEITSQETKAITKVHNISIEEDSKETEEEIIYVIPENTKTTEEVHDISTEEKVLENNNVSIEQTTVVNDTKEEQEKIDTTYDNKKMEQKTSTDNGIKKEDYIKMLELLRTPTFGQMMSTLSIKDAVIISLKLGYIDGKYFSTDAISEFLQIDKEEVRESFKRILLLYRDNINEFVDNAINNISNNKQKINK